MAPGAHPRRRPPVAARNCQRGRGTSRVTFLGAAGSSRPACRAASTTRTALRKPCWAGRAHLPVVQRTVRPFRSKEEAGHEEPRFTFLVGDNPDYPEKILAAAQAQAGHRLARMRPIARVMSPRPTFTCGSSPIRLSPKPWFSSPGASVRSSATEGRSRPGFATTTPSAAVPACPQAWPPWYPASTPRPPWSNWSTWTRRTSTG
jgi:hypothetical protein